MFKKIIIFLSISFLVFFVSLYFYHIKEKQFNDYINQVQKINSEIDKEYLSGITNINIKNNDSKVDKQKLMEEMIADNLADVDTILKSSNYENKNWETLRYKKLYISSMNKKNIDLAIKAIHNILEKTDNKGVWYKKLVDLYIETWQFKLAEQYSKKLLEVEWTKENLKNYLYIKLQNVNFFAKEQVEEIKDLVHALYEKNVISAQDLSFYDFLIDLLSHWNVENLDKNIEMLTKDIDNDKYKNLLLSFKNDYETYKKSKWSPLYYFKSLVALDLLKFWYFWLARNIAENVYIQDSSYILSQQILAYSYFFMWNYQNAIKYLKMLKQDDKNNQNDYNFYLWISHYRIQKPKDALLYLSQLNWDYPYYKDVLRYMLLSYMQIKDSVNVKKTIYKLSKYKLSYVDYYNIFKYLLFDCEKCYKTELKTLISLIRSCYKDVEKWEEYVCWYGKWNLFLKAWKKELAVKYFELLSKYFQDPYIFDTLASYNEKKWNYKQAKLYYLKELLYTENKQKRSVLQEKIKKLFINK